MKLFPALMLAVSLVSPIQARNLGQWGNSDPELAKWYRNLKEPDRPEVGCCGEGDAYWCDDIFVKDGFNYCRITDDRDDEPRKRTHIPVGTVIQIPDRKFNKDQNPTGHAVVFLGWYANSKESMPDSYSVYCFISPAGV